MDRVLVTGAAGLVGEAVCRALVAEGVRIIATWVRKKPSFLHAQVDWVQWNLLSDLAASVREVGAVFHLAATIPGVPAERSDGDAAEVNRKIDETIFRLASERQVHLIYASSTSVYGKNPAGRLLREEDPAAPTSRYAEEKVWAESRGRVLMDGAALWFASLRISSPYGPGQPDGKVLSIFIRRAIHGQALLYFGSGSREQSFIHVDDVARAFLRAWKVGATGVFNIAGQAVTMKGLARLVAHEAGLGAHAVQPAGVPDPNEEERGRFSIQAAEGRLGWTPRIPLGEGIGGCIRACRETAAP
jgi:UDP-glucose 4-epimerase